MRTRRREPVFRRRRSCSGSTAVARGRPPSPSTTANGCERSRRRPRAGRSRCASAPRCSGHLAAALVAVEADDRHVRGVEPVVGDAGRVIANASPSRPSRTLRLPVRPGVSAARSGAPSTTARRWDSRIILPAPLAPRTHLFCDRGSGVPPGARQPTRRRDRTALFRSRLRCPDDIRVDVVTDHHRLRRRPLEASQREREHD